MGTGAFCPKVKSQKRHISAIINLYILVLYDLFATISFLLLFDKICGGQVKYCDIIVWNIFHAQMCNNSVCCSMMYIFVYLHVCKTHFGMLLAPRAPIVLKDVTRSENCHWQAHDEGGYSCVIYTLIIACVSRICYFRMLQGALQP